MRPWLAAEREEGAAARILGVPRERNPYRGAAALGHAQELENAWLSGWTLGAELPRQRAAARESREAVAAILRAESLR